MNDELHSQDLPAQTSLRVLDDRRFYFLDSQEIRTNCESLKTWSQFEQFLVDAKRCPRNDIWIKEGFPGIWCLDWALEIGPAKRWVFFTRRAYDRLSASDQALVKRTFEGYSILE
jgi:hypothetical protein